MASSDDSQGKNEKNTQQEDERLVDNGLARLSEHFESVQIMVVKHKPEGTHWLSKGCGNFFSRYGAAKEWVLKEEHRMKLSLDNVEPEERG